MNVQITSIHFTVTFSILGGLNVTETVLNVTEVITRFYIKQRCSVSMPLCILFTMSVRQKNVRGLVLLSGSYIQIPAQVRRRYGACTVHIQCMFSACTPPIMF